MTLLFTICLRKSFSDIVLWQNSQAAGSQPFSVLFTNTACTQRSKSREQEPLGSTLTIFSCLQYFTQPALSVSLYGESRQNLTSKSSSTPSSLPSSIFKLSSYCPDAMLTIQCRQQYFFVSRTKQNKESTFTTNRIIMATTNNSPRKFLLEDITSREL